MRLGRFMNKSLVSVGGALVLFGSATLVSAQRSEYNEYQEALRNEQIQCARYQRNPSRSNWNECQDARRDTREEYAKYQRELREEGAYRYNDRYSRNRVVTYPQRGMYRINMGGRYYNVDNRGYSILREAVNRGYQQGYQAGLRDRRYSRYNVYNNNVYMSGTFGYNSAVARNQYQYYFQQGFQKGYEDGYYARTQYGYRSGTTTNILGSVLNTILNIADAVDNDDDYR